jgi:hypothetical protein
MVYLPRSLFQQVQNTVEVVRKVVVERKEALDNKTVVHIHFPVELKLFAWIKARHPFYFFCPISF